MKKLHPAYNAMTHDSGLRRAPFGALPLALAVAGALLAAPLAQAGVQVVNTFDNGLGTWSTTVLNHDNGYDLDWSNTSHAGGDPGEVGGLVIRFHSDTSPSALGMPRILDTINFRGQPVDLNMPLSVSGLLYAQDISANTTVHMGYYNVGAPSDQRLILRVVDPSDSGTGLWRFRFAAGGSGSKVTVPDNSWDSTPLRFSFQWTPSGLGDGSGTVSGQVQKVSGGDPLVIPSVSLGANTFAFNAFGLWIDSSGSTKPDRQQIVFFDNVEYTIVPEPSTFLLGAMGTGLLFLLRRRTKV